jgi:hypothetical protein
VRDAVIGRHHYACHRGQPRADDEGHGDDAVGVDAHQARDLRVLCRRAHRGAEARAVDHPREARHHRHRDEDDAELDVGDGGLPYVEGHGLHRLRERQRVAAPDHQREVLQDDRDADGGDQRREARRLAQRPVRDPFHGVADRHAQRDRARGGQHDDGDRRQARSGQQVDHAERHHRTDHHHLAVGEVDELDDAVDHRVAERHDGVHRAERKTVDDLLDEDVHQRGRGIGVPAPARARSSRGGRSRPLMTCWM